MDLVRHFDPPYVLSLAPEKEIASLIAQAID